MKYWLIFMKRFAIHAVWISVLICTLVVNHALEVYAGSDEPVAAPRTSASALDQGKIRRLAVTGVCNETREQELSKLLVADGVAQLAAQELYDTGLFMMVEENPEITKRIQELIALSTSSGAGQQKTDSTFAQLGCDAVADIKIRKFSKSRIRSFAGPFSASNVDIAIDVEVSVKLKEGRIITASGTGTGSTRASGVLLEVRNDKIHFDKTSAGIAMQAAVKEAVQKIAAEMEGKQ
ncbi:MAG: hypothetical protein HY888_12060 [Deltaproteobacteria bacterium]|nr:hypothetical protein [Deltaproteobacteria bacterium]